MKRLYLKTVKVAKLNVFHVLGNVTLGTCKVFACKGRKQQSRSQPTVG